MIEGECSCINTFDLTVDHVFYELAMHPWTVRNELDHFLVYLLLHRRALAARARRSGSRAASVSVTTWARGSISPPEKGAAYPTPMTQEELQNWILCAALYWKTTGDNAWLRAEQGTFQRALESMQLRDDLDPAKRDGITTYISNSARASGEITTYDAMDASLQHPINSLYITVKSFALLPDAAAGVPPTWRDRSGAAGPGGGGLHGQGFARRIGTRAASCFPPTFDGNSASSIIPAVEGLVYPYAMGLSEDVALGRPERRADQPT